MRKALRVGLSLFTAFILLAAAFLGGMWYQDREYSAIIPSLLNEIRCSRSVTMAATCSRVLEDLREQEIERAMKRLEIQIDVALLDSSDTRPPLLHGIDFMGSANWHGLRQDRELFPRAGTNTLDEAAINAELDRLIAQKAALTHKHERATD